MTEEPLACATAIPFWLSKKVKWWRVPISFHSIAGRGDTKHTISDTVRDESCGCMALATGKRINALRSGLATSQNWNKENEKTHSSLLREVAYKLELSPAIFVIMLLYSLCDLSMVVCSDSSFTKNVCRIFCKTSIRTYHHTKVCGAKIANSLQFVPYRHSRSIVRWKEALL